MSNAEVVTSDTKADSQLSEISKPNQTEAPMHPTECTVPINVENSSVPLIEAQNTPVKPTEPTEVPVAVNPITEKISTNTVAENSPVCPAKGTNETEVVTKNGEIQQSPVIESNEESSKASKIEGSESMAAGEPCSPNSKDANKIVANQTSVSPTEPQINNCTSQIDKSFVEHSAEINVNEQTISKLQSTVQKMTEERDSYQKKLEITEKKLAALQSSYDDLLKGGGDETMLRRMMEQLKAKLIQTSLQLEDRIRIVANQEKQISALNNQVASLKEVEALTRSLLQIRNMEVKHLQAEVDDMEVRITEERERYNTMINKMDAAVQLNASLKKEYETQLNLFRDLREKYEEKVTLLSAEKRALETAAQSVSK